MRPEELKVKVETPGADALAVGLGELVEMALTEPGRLQPPRLTVGAMLKAYLALSAAEKVAFSRKIGVERCWLPRQRRAA